LSTAQRLGVLLVPWSFVVCLGAFYVGLLIPRVATGPWFAVDMRSADAAAHVLEQGEAYLSDGNWYISVGEAEFRFSQRTRVVAPDNRHQRRVPPPGSKRRRAWYSH